MSAILVRSAKAAGQTATGQRAAKLLGDRPWTNETSAEGAQSSTIACHKKTARPIVEKRPYFHAVPLRYQGSICCF